jgi:hypothetical protein
MQLQEEYGALKAYCKYLRRTLENRLCQFYTRVAFWQCFSLHAHKQRVKMLLKTLPPVVAFVFKEKAHFEP